MKQEEYEKTAELVLGELDEALHLVAPDSVERLLEAVDAADQVFFVGVGRVMLALEAIAKRWAHLGVKTHLVGEITEPAITPNDLLIVGKIVHIGSNPNSPLREISEFMVRIPVRTKAYLEDEIDSQQPMTSLFEQSLLLLGDISAKMMIERKQLDMKSLWQYHANLE